MIEIVPAQRALTRQEMREALQQQKGILGTIYHVGSHPSSATEALNKVILVEAARSGFISWTQGSSALEDMDIQPNYHPQLGLYYQDGALHFDEEKFIKQIDELGTADLDFHPFAAQGWYSILENAQQLKDAAVKSGRVVIAKSHIATPSCSEHVLPENAKPYQPLWYRAEMRGHIKRLKSIGEVQIVSGDDPHKFSIRTLLENFTTMFGDIYGDDGKLIQQGEDVLRAIHCCGDWDILGAMETGAVDVVHYDALQYGPEILRGKPEILKTYLDQGGMIAWGGIPQSYIYLEDLAMNFGRRFSIRNPADYTTLAEFLNDNRTTICYLIKHRYDVWLNTIANEANYDPKKLARQTFIGATCGYGPNKNGELRETSYQLARDVADGIKVSYS